MRTKIIVAMAILVLILAQIVYSLSKRKPTRVTALALTPEAVVQTEKPFASLADLPSETTDGQIPAPLAEIDPEAEINAEKTGLEPLATAGIGGVIVSDAAGAVLVELRRDEGGWLISTLFDAPADGNKISRFLDKLLNAARMPVFLNEAVDAGLEPGEGLGVSLLGADDSVILSLDIGLRPADSYDSVFAREGGRDGGSIFRLAWDVRGDLGLWQNTPSAKPDSRAWLASRLLNFEPTEVSAFEGGSPEPDFRLEKDASGEWRITIEEADVDANLDQEGIAALLVELADLRIDAAFPAIQSEEAIRVFAFRLELTGGDRLSLEVFMPFNSDDSGALLRLADHPDILYHLPAWRLDRFLDRFHLVAR